MGKSTNFLAHVYLCKHLFVVWQIYRNGCILLGSAIDLELENVNSNLNYDSYRNANEYEVWYFGKLFLKWLKTWQNVNVSVCRHRIYLKKFHFHCFCRLCRTKCIRSFPTASLCWNKVIAPTKKNTKLFRSFGIIFFLALQK